MPDHAFDSDTAFFLKSLGFPELKIHHAFNHFDFVRSSRRILVIGPMGSGKTEYSSRVWRESQQRGLIFIFPTLILNFRKSFFNASARLLLDLATDVFPLTAYCEHSDCTTDSFYIYRYYHVDGRECPALYFDPLIIVGGDARREDSREPNYCTRCDLHHYLPGKEYTFLVLKPLGAAAARGDLQGLREELYALHGDLSASQLQRSFAEHYNSGRPSDEINNNALRVACIAERALLFLFVEENLVSETQMQQLVGELDLDRDFLVRRLRDARRACRLDISIDSAEPRDLR